MFFTLRTFVGSLSQVGSPVCNKLQVPIKDITTFGTFTGLFSCVDSVVFNRVCPLVEALPTLQAHVGSLSHVGCKAPIHADTFPTLWAIIGSLCCADSLMSENARAAAGAFPTFRALVGSPSSMWIPWCSIRCAWGLWLFPHSLHL